MNFKPQLLAFVCIWIISQSYSQNSVNDTVMPCKISVSTPWHTFVNFGAEQTNTHHCEFHVTYKLTPKDKIGIKVATWKLFAPMGIPLWDSLIMKESEFYPGRLRENGIGVSYQRFISKGLFASVEILPQIKTYLDKNNTKVGTGFKLYTSYHVGYYFAFLQGRLFIEPQIHCQYWPIDTNTPLSFKQNDDKWNNYFLFEPNIKIGVNF